MENKLALSKRKYHIAHQNTIAPEEYHRFIALGLLVIGVFHRSIRSGLDGNTPQIRIRSA